MKIVVAGINHRSVPLELLAQAAPDEAAAERMIEAARKVASEAFVLATCNRLELYAVTDAVPRIAPDLTGILAATQPLPLDVQGRIRDAVELHSGRSAVRHLFRVASGVESLVAGETEIAWQLRAALARAQRVHGVGPLLQRLLEKALHTQKRVRQIAPGHLTSPSTVAAGLRLALDGARSLHDLTVAVVGAGRVAQEALWHVARLRPRRVVVTNRTLERAKRLARRFGAAPVPWELRHAALAQADLVISGIAGHSRALSADELALARAGSGERTLTALELGMPPGLDPAIRRLPNVRLITLGDIARNSRGPSPHGGGGHDQAAADHLIEAAVEEFIAWSRARRAVPVVAGLQRSSDGIRSCEVARALRRLPHAGDREQRVIDDLARRIVSKMLHAPIAQLKDVVRGAPRTAPGDRRSRSLAGSDEEVSDTTHEASGHRRAQPLSGSAPALTAPSAANARIHLPAAGRT